MMAVRRAYNRTAPACSCAKSVKAAVLILADCGADRGHESGSNGEKTGVSE